MIETTGEIVANKEPIASMTGYTSSRRELGLSCNVMDRLRCEDGSGESEGDGVEVLIF